MILLIAAGRDFRTASPHGQSKAGPITAKRGKETAKQPRSKVVQLPSTSSISYPPPPRPRTTIGPCNLSRWLLIGPSVQFLSKVSNCRGKIEGWLFAIAVVTLSLCFCRVCQPRGDEKSSAGGDKISSNKFLLLILCRTFFSDILRIFLFASSRCHYFSEIVLVLSLHCHVRVAPALNLMKRGEGYLSSQCRTPSVCYHFRYAPSFYIAFLPGASCPWAYQR